jgi:hypothetical protein
VSSKVKARVGTRFEALGRRMGRLAENVKTALNTKVKEHLFEKETGGAKINRLMKC